jgi:hypothetical protein
VNYLLGTLLAVQVALYIWERWTNRASALPSALEKIAVQGVANTQLTKQNAQLILDKVTLVKEVDAQKKRADEAEAERDRILQESVAHLHGAALPAALDGVLRPEAGAGDDTGGAGDGDAPPPNVQPGRIPVG